MSAYKLAESPTVGPGVGVVWHVELSYYAELEAVTLWDGAQWDTATGTWEGPPPPVDIACDVLSISSGYGRDEPTGRFRPGAATVNVDDPNGELSPWRAVPVAGNDPYGAVRPGIRMTIAADYAGERWPIFVGYVQSITDGFPNPSTGGHTVTITAADALQFLAAYDGLEQPAIGAGETAGPRLSRIIGMTGYDGPVELDAGRVPLQATTLAQNALGEAGLVVDTELGAFFVRRDGVVRFVDRDTLTTTPEYTTVQYVFGEVAPELCYSEVELVTNAETVRNVVSVANVGGSAVTRVDSDSAGMYGQRTYQRFDLIHVNASESAVIADRYLALYASSARRVESLTILPSVHTETIEAALALGVLWRIQIRRRAEGFQVVADLQIQAVEQQITPHEWRVVYRTFSAAAIFGAGKWDAAKWDAADAKWGY